MSEVRAAWGEMLAMLAEVRLASSMSRELLATPASPLFGGTMEVITLAPASSLFFKPFRQCIKQLILIGKIITVGIDSL